MSSFSSLLTFLPLCYALSDMFSILSLFPSVWFLLLDFVWLFFSFVDLCSRLEVPSEEQRWDRPLSSSLYEVGGQLAEEEDCRRHLEGRRIC